MTRASLLIAGLLLAACGEAAPAGAGRADLTIDGTSCTPPCAISHYHYLFTPAGTKTCTLNGDGVIPGGVATPGKEVIIPSTAYSLAVSSVGVIVVAFCAQGDCPRCAGYTDLPLDDGATATLQLQLIADCVKKLPWTTIYPPPSCS